MRPLSDWERELLAAIGDSQYPETPDRPARLREAEPHPIGMEALRLRGGEVIHYEVDDMGCVVVTEELLLDLIRRRFEGMSDARVAAARQDAEMAERRKWHRLLIEENDSGAMESMQTHALLSALPLPRPGLGES
jgi:hypothetical protein